MIICVISKFTGEIFHQPSATVSAASSRSANIPLWSMTICSMDSAHSHSRRNSLTKTSMVKKIGGQNNS